VTDGSVEEIVDQIHATDRPRLVAYVTGGGTEVLPMLLRRGGGSSTLLSARVPYAPEDFRLILGFDPGRMVDSRAARGLAMAAFRHALKIRGDLTPGEVFGLGSTSKLAKGDDERSGRSHEIHAALQTATSTVSWSVTLPKGLNRMVEERLNAILLLNLIAEAKGVRGRVPLETEDGPLPSESIIIREASAEDCGCPALEQVMIGQSRWTSIDFGPVNELTDVDAPRLLLPGSFRPLHEGHLAMAEAASARMGVRCDFEMTLSHPEKPTLDYLAIQSRLSPFTGLAARVYLTDAPTYLEKARLFPACTFVVGHDTALRIVDPRFYGGQVGRDACLAELERLGIRFLIFGRVDASGEFRDFSHEEFEHPVAGFLDRTALAIRGEDFRFDISSTEVRRQSSEEFD
jgi:hypothetical protein